MIQFARYLPLLAARGAHVLVEMYADLKPLFETIDGVAQVVTPDAANCRSMTCLTPLLSLPLAFGTSLDTIPAQVPYLRVPDHAHGALGRAAWSAHAVRALASHGGVRSTSPAFDGARRVGAGTATSRIWSSTRCKRKFPRRTRIGSLAHPLVTDHSAALEDFADTAALIAHMDLVISIDTSVAHLAGALGKPVWIMLPFSPDWRWLRDREDSPWYPTARLFRQTRRGDWDDVVRRVAEALSVERFKYQIEGDQHGIVAADQ